MSTLSGVSSKGEKGKPKFQSLDINSLYNKTSRGESSEPHTQKSTVPRKHGMQSLGKVPSARRPPANLPSLKSEHSGNDPTVSLVPTGGTGWGSKPGETGPTPTTQAPPQTSPANSVNHSLGTSAPAAVGSPAPQTNIISQPPTQGQVSVKQSGGSTTSGGDKTWSSVMSGAETGPSFLAHQSPQFQQEFPSLSGEAAAPVPPVKGPIGQEGQYGPGPSLRPQTEGSWIQGGGTRAPPPVTTGNNSNSSNNNNNSGTNNSGNNNTSSPPQHPFLPQESAVTGGNRNNLGQFGSGTVPGGPQQQQQQQPPQIPSQFKGVVPPFMLNRGGGFPSMFPANFPSSTIRPRFHAPSENRFAQGSRQPPVADPEDLIPRPIIREEDLNRMDEISRDTGWATQDDIDYNQKLAFSDDENERPDENKDISKDNSAAHKSSSPLIAKDDIKDIDNDKDMNDKLNDRLSGMNEKQPQPWQGRGPSSMSAADYRSQMSRSSPHPVTIAAREVDMLEEHWKEKRRQVSEKVAAVTEKAKQRKEEEEKRFEESRTKSHLDMEQKVKKGKEDIHSIDQHTNNTINEWEKDNSLPVQARDNNKEAVDNFRQMTQLDNRPNFNREKERDREMRGDRDGGQPFQRFQSNLPPRFQKQMNDRPGNQQYMRQSASNVNNSMQNFESRWSMSNSHSSSHFSGKQSNNTGRRNDTEISDRDVERDRMKDSEEKERRERLTPEPSNERDRRDREELEWEGRRGNSSWDHNRHYDDKYQGRRDAKKSSNEVYSNKTHDRDNEWRDRPQRPESRERPDRPARPDSRDSRASRDSRNSRDSMRDDSRAIPELMNNDYPWADIEYEKEIREEKSRKKDSYKDDKRDNLPRREGHVPGPITREKMEAYEHKQNLAKAEKKELMVGNNANSSINAADDESWSKLQPNTTSSLGTSSNTVSWADSTEEGVASSNQAKDGEQNAVQTIRNNDDTGDKVTGKENINDKKKEMSIKDKDKSSRGGRGGRNRSSGNYQTGSNYSVFYRGSGSSWNSKDSRRPSNKGSSQKQGQWNASESEASADEVSASTESGKEDKKSERKQMPRSPRPGERKREKEERNRESKKNDNDKSRQDKKQVNVNQGGSGYESGGGGGGGGGGNRKEGFAPRGEPSRRGRGGFRSSRGNLGNVAGHYGPPGNKSPFPSHGGQHDVKQDDDTQSQQTVTQTAPSSDVDSSTMDDKSKQKQQSHVQQPVTGNRQNKDVISNRPPKNKPISKKVGSGGEEWETTSEASDSESKNVKHSKIQHKLDKNKSQRLSSDKRGQFSTAHMNGRPSRSEDGKDNGFQEVRSKKIGKETRPIGKDETKRGRGKEGKNKVLQGTNPTAKSVPSKFHSTREWSNNKPPRLQRLENNRKQQQQQQQQDVSEMNKINQNVTLFPLREVVTCSSGTPAPPPPVNAWDKPITATLRTTPPPSNSALHLTSTMSNSQDKSAIDLNEHGQSGGSSQTSSPSAEKALTKMSRDAVEKAILDGATPPVQTIIFENTNYKVPSEMAMKAKYSSLKGQRIDKTRGKLDEDLEGSSHGIGLGGFKPGSEIKQGENKPQETIQIPMSFSKNEDNADMKLDFAFDSDLSQLTEDKTNLPRSIHIGQTSTADLNQKIASVKKVWETPGAVMEHHVDENHGVVSTSSSFTPNFGSAVDTALDHSTAHQVDDTSFNNSDVYSGPSIQANAGAYSTGGANIIKQDPNSASNNVKPQPQQTTVMSSGIGNHSAPSLSSPPPAFTQQGHFNYQAQYGNMPAIPSPPAVLINSATGAQQVNHQGELFHSFPLGGATVIGNQAAAAARSGFSQYYSLSQGIGQTSAAAFSQPSLYHLPQPAAPPPPPNAPPDVFSSLSTYRIQPSAYGQSQQLSNNPSTVLITSSSNSLMSASVKSSPQPPISAIGSKGGYQSSAHPSQVPLGFIQYETQMLPQNFLQNSQLVQQRHGGSNVVPTIQPPTSYYSGSGGGQTGLFQPGSSILANTGSQPGLHSAATAFGMQGFGTQSAGNPGAAPSSSNPVVPSFTTQMGHFRAPAPTYLKAGNHTGQHPSDASKSPSNHQDVLNCVFSTGGGQIPSPKSRTTGGGGGSSGSAGSAGSVGGSGKQVGPSSVSQQPSPTQSHHKFSSYQSQHNLVLQQQGNNQSNRGGPQMSGGVRNSGNNSGNASSGSLATNGVNRYPTPIQRPVGYQQQQQQMMQQAAVAVGASSVNQPRHRLSSSRTHIKISNQYYSQQGNSVKLDGANLEGKTDADKLQETNTSTTKQDKGKEETSSNNEQ